MSDISSDIIPEYQDFPLFHLRKMYLSINYFTVVRNLFLII